MAENDKPDAVPAKSRPWLRRLRIAWTVFFAVLSAALCLLWLRSYWQDDSLRIQFAHESSHGYLTIDGGGGKLWLQLEPDWSKTTGNFGGAPIDRGIYYDSNTYDAGSQEASLQAYFGVGENEELPFFLRNVGLTFQFGNPIYDLILPHWLIAVCCAGLAALPWFPFRFSLRTLLVATTLIAVVLGMIVWANR